MSIDVAAPTATDQRTAAMPRAATTRPATSPAPLTVPAKPAAVTAANVATLAGTAAIAAGPAGWAVAAGTAGVVGAGMVIRRVVRRRRAPGGSRTRWGGRPGARFGMLGFGGGRSPRPGVAGGRGAGLGLGAPTGGRPAGSKPSPRPRTTGSGGSLLGGSTPSRRVGAGFGGGHAKAGGRNAGGAAAPGGRPRSGTARAAYAARRAARVGGRGAVAVGRGTARAARWARRRLAMPAWNRARRFVRRHVLGDKTKPETTTGVKPEVPGDTVRRPNQPADGQTATRRPATTADRDTRTGRSSNEREPVMAPTPNQQQKSPQPIGPVYLAARQVHATAVNYTVKGTMELRTEAYEFPHTLAEIAAAVRARVAHCTREAIDPAYAQALNQIATTVDAAAQAAQHLGEAFDALHRVKVDRILRPGPNEQKWDVSNNRP